VKRILRPDAPGKEIIECRAGVRAAADPAAHDVVALGDEIGRAAEAEVGECPAEAVHEIRHIRATATRLMQRILQQHVGGGEFLDHLGIPGIAPEFREPAADDGLVFLFLGHGKFPSCWCRCARSADDAASVDARGDVRRQRFRKYPPAAAN
jgi:hypothetical protein